MIIISTLCNCGGSGNDDGIIVTVIFPHSVFVVVYYVFLYHFLRIYVLFFTYFCIIFWCLRISVLYFGVYYVFPYCL